MKMVFDEQFSVNMVFDEEFSMNMVFDERFSMNMVFDERFSVSRQPSQNILSRAGRATYCAGQSVCTFRSKQPLFNAFKMS